MSKPSTLSRAAWYIDSHFGYSFPESNEGPCRYVVDYVVETPDSTTTFVELVGTEFMKDYLDAMDLVRNGTDPRVFTAKPGDRGHGFNLWWPEIDDKLVNLRDYLTDEIRAKLLEKVFTAEVFNLDAKALEGSYKKLCEARDRLTESEPQWGAMYLIIRLFEATLVHVAWHHKKIRAETEREVGERGGTYLRACKELAIKQALASNERWKRSLGLLEHDETPPQQVVRLATVIPLFGR